MRMRSGVCALLTLLIVSLPALAGAAATDRDTLIAKIEAAGQNETEYRRHYVAVQDCTMKTQLWQNHAEQGWVLWSSFTFSMPNVSFRETGSAKGRSEKFMSAAAPRESGRPDLVIIPFNMRDNTTALYERSTLRKAIEGSWPSQRNDGTTHRFSDSDRFMIIHEGFGVIAKAQAFIAAFEDYVLHHCTFTG